jgi:membrane protease YdiL (CAAX protease family)
MPIRLNRSDYRTIGLTVLMAAASLAVAIRYFHRAFPEASLTFKVSRGQSESIATAFLRARGFDSNGYDHAARFGYDDMAKLYLERTKGIDGMNALTRGPIHLWRWQHRWFKPVQKEEFRADVTPMGEVVSFDHELPETAPGANLDQTAARKLAEDFLTGVMKRDLNDLEFVEAVTTKRPARTDHDFTWKLKTVNLGDGSYRIEVGVSGDRVSGYTEFVKVPEQWQRDYERLRSKNDAAQSVDQVFWFLLCVAMLVWLILRLRDRDVPLRLAGLAGGTAAVLFLLEQLNEFSLSKFGYPTTDPYASFVTRSIVADIFLSIGVGVAIFLLVASAEPMYREGFPVKLSLSRAITWKGVRSKPFFIANVVGLGLTFFFFAYQAVFYVVANHLGAWAPSDVPFTDDLNTSIPWAAVLFGGFLPAVLEEMQFRAFAIPFLHKYLRNWPLAIVLAAFNWGFLHAAYPNQPFFIRGVEVGVGGIIIGFVMLRFGVIATLIWHYSVDALYTAFLLLRSPNHYLMASGALTAGIMLVPLIVALVAYWRAGTFADESGLTNAAQGITRGPREATPEEIETPLDYQPLNRGRLALAGALIVAGAALAAVPAYHFGKGVQVRITRGQAIASADRYLAGLGVPVRSYEHVAVLADNVDGEAEKYLLQFRGVQDVDHLYRQASKLALWHVRYFKPLQKEEYTVFVDVESGKVFDFTHELDENAPGASLSPDQALDIGRRYLTAQGFNLSGFDLQNSEATKRKAREDYALTWQAKSGDPLNVGDEHYRVEVGIAGDQVTGVRRYFKLPENWEREQRETKLVNVALIALQVLLGGGIIAGVIWLFVMQVRKDGLAWRKTRRVALFVGLLLVISELNSLVMVRENYPTSMSMGIFDLFIVIGYFLVPLAIGLFAWVLAALVVGLYPDTWRIFSAWDRRVWARDAAVALIVALAVGAGISNLGTLFFDHFHAYASPGTGIVNGSFAESLPALGIVLPSFYLYTVFSLAGLALAIRLAMIGWRQRAWWLWLAIVLLVLARGPATAHSLRQFLIPWVPGVIGLIAAWGMIALFFRNNIAAYIAVAFTLPLIEPLIALLRDPAPFYRWNGVLLAVTIAVVLVAMFFPRAKASGEAGG